MGLGVLGGFEPGGPDVAVGQAGQDGDGDEFRLTRDGVARRFHHVEAARGMDIDDGRTRREPHQRRQRRGHGIRNVMQLEIEKDRQALGGNRLVAPGAMGVEEFHAHFHEARVGFEGARQASRPVEIGRIEGNADGVAGGHAAF